MNDPTDDFLFSSPTACGKWPCLKKESSFNSFLSPEDSLKYLFLFFFAPTPQYPNLKEQHPAAPSILSFSSASYIELGDVIIS